MHLPRRSWLPAAVVALMSVVVGGCFFSGGSTRTDRSSSVVNFLYPGENNPLPPTTIPVLRLPLRVGIAFVPSGDAKNPYSDRSGISETQKNVVMQRVKAEFKAFPFV